MDTQEAELRIKQEWEMVKDAIKDDRLLNVAVKLRKENKAINYYIWDVVIKGRDDTIFEGGKFKGTVNFPGDYPAKPPVFLFAKVNIDG